MADASPASKAAARLTALARTAFTELWPAEQRLLQKVTTPDGLDLGPGFPWVSARANVDVETNTAEAGFWGHDREVRSVLLRWLCTDRDAKALVDPRGIVLAGARIVGALNLNFTEIPFMFALRRCRIPRNSTFVAAQIKEVDIDGSWTAGLDFDRAVVTNNVWLDNALRADGVVSLVSTKIGGDLVCSQGSRFVNKVGNAFYADYVTVEGSIHFRSWTNVGDPDEQSIAPIVEGLASFFGARVGGDFDCSGTQFVNPGKTALNLSRAHVNGRLVLMSWKNAVFATNGGVDLSNASVGVLQDEEKTWPAPGRMQLDGFVYGGFGGDAPRSSESRLRWLELDPKAGVQPYRHLARILQDIGDSRGAKDVLKKMEARASIATGELTAWRALRWSIGYGYQPENAVYGLALVTLAGWLVAWRHERMGSMVPTEKDAAAEFQQSRTVPSHYPRFQPLIFSLEKTFPLVRLGQADKWQADPAPKRRWARATQWFIWGQVLLGWLLATLFLAGLSGLIRRVQ